MGWQIRVGGRPAIDSGRAEPPQVRHQSAAGQTWQQSDRTTVFHRIQEENHKCPMARSLRQSSGGQGRASRSVTRGALSSGTTKRRVQLNLSLGQDAANCAAVVSIIARRVSTPQRSAPKNATAMSTGVSAAWRRYQGRILGGWEFLAGRDQRRRGADHAPRTPPGRGAAK